MNPVQKYLTETPRHEKPEQRPYQFQQKYTVAKILILLEVRRNLTTIKIKKMTKNIKKTKMVYKIGLQDTWTGAYRLMSLPSATIRIF